MESKSPSIFFCSISTIYRDFSSHPKPPKTGSSGVTVHTAEEEIDPKIGNQHRKEGYDAEG